MVRGERFNAITHLVATIVAFAATSVAIALAAKKANATTVVAVAVYGTMLVGLYLVSTLYHTIDGPAKRVFHILDHSAIYLLIAGTYTPFTLVTLPGTLGWWLFATIWSLATVGIVKDALFRNRFRALSVTLYVLMGW